MPKRGQVERIVPEVAVVPAQEDGDGFKTADRVVRRPSSPTLVTTTRNSFLVL